MSACQWPTAIFTNTPKDGPKVPHSEMCSNKDFGLRPQEENSRKPEPPGHATPWKLGTHRAKPSSPRSYVTQKSQNLIERSWSEPQRPQFPS